MKILIVTQTYWPDPNGQSVFTTHLAEGLAKAGHRVLVLMPAEGWRSACAPRRGVRLCRVPAVRMPWYDTVRLTPFPMLAARRVVRGFRPDVVHIQDHYFLAEWVAREAARQGIPLLGTNHFLPANLSQNFPLPPRLRPALQPAIDALLWKSMLRVYNRLDFVTAPTATAAEILRRQRLVPPVMPISCGVDTDRFRPRPAAPREAMRRKYGLHPQKPLFLFVGRVDGEKRLDVLLHAAARLPRDDFQIAIAGKGLHAESLQALAETLRLGARVRFLGYVPAADLPGLLNAADVFVMPSEAELQSIATLEAMASGLPVLAARAQALPELVEDGVNGYLFRPGDAADAARLMARLLAERPRWEALGAAGREKALAHSLASTVQHYEAAYRAAMTAHLKRAWAQVPQGKGKKSRRGVWWKN